MKTRIITDLFRRPVVLALSLVILGSPAVAQDKPLPCPAGDSDCLVEAIVSSPAKKLEFWSAAMRKPMEDRIGVAPAELIEMLRLVNAVELRAQKPRATPVPREFLADVRRALSEVPEAVRKRADGKLAGIYFAHDLGTTAFSDQVYGENGEPRGAFIVLDPSVLMKRTANTWATWRENTPFRANPAFRLEATLEDQAHDDRRAAIRYNLLHELAHVISVGEKFHPGWDVPPMAVAPEAKFAFFDLSWTIPRPQNRYISHFDYAFPQRGSVMYYRDGAIAGADMLSTYERLEQTNFATLHGATNPGDDFAEALANYVHTVMMKRPFEVRIYRDGLLAKRYGACWDEERCAEKRRILEKFLVAG
jgi:hypothetical protein